MSRRAVPLLLLAAALAGTAAATASGSTTVTKPQAIAIVRGILNRNAHACDITRIVSIGAVSRGLDRWFVTAKIKDNGFTDTVRYTVVGRKAVPNDPLAAEIVAHCP